MKKTLVIVAHPNMHRSRINQRWIDRLAQEPDRYTVHDLYKAYPDSVIDVEREQKLVQEHDTIIFQFPMFWFSSPPLLNQWQDEVLTYNWAYGSSGNALVGKKFSVAVAAGIWEEDYSQEGRYTYTIEEVLRPFEMTVKYCKANYYPYYALFGTETKSDTRKELSESEIQASVDNYIAHLEKIAAL